MPGFRLLALALLVLTAAATAAAQSPGVDGIWQWQGARSADPFCSQLVFRAFTVRQGSISGTLGHTRGTFSLSGQITPDGRASFFADGPFGHLGRGTGQFASANATGSIRFSAPDVYCEIGWTAARQR